MNVDEVLLAEPRGFCAGVEMAIKALAYMVRIFDGPVYCYHQIVHNQIIVERFERAGVRFVDEISSIPEGAPLMLSAHGTAPEVINEAVARGAVVVDAVCPLVTKVHHEVRSRARDGYQVVYVGHGGHDEAVGTVAQSPESVHLVENAEDVVALEIEPTAKVAFLAQTTLAVDEWGALRQLTQHTFSNMWQPNRSDLCYATTNRQAAVKELAHNSDAILVLGSENSSNTRALERVAKEAGCANVYRINSSDEIPAHLAGTIGVTAGASAPEDLVTAVVNKLAPKNGVRTIAVIDESEYFPPPRELRSLLGAIASATSYALGVQTPVSISLDDRSMSASMALADLEVRS